MQLPKGTSFNPERGIGQGDTPSTLIFIAVFNILLTLLEESHIDKAHAYADDVVHMAPPPPPPARKAYLVCGFCAFTGLEISVGKVEAIYIHQLSPWQTPHSLSYPSLLG